MPVYRAIRQNRNMADDAIEIQFRETASTRLLGKFRRAIESKRWPPGHQIPTERSLAMEFSLARNTVRRALKILEDEGTIVRDVGRGTFVADGRPAVSPTDLASRIQNASPAEVMEVRLMIEPQAAELSATRANGAEIDAMMECLKRSEEVKSVADFEMWDGLFHQTLMASCHNQLLIDIYDAINAVRRKADWAKLKERVMTPARRQSTQKQHRKIMAALRTRDADGAAVEMMKHLQDVKRSILGS
ncbi:MAG: lldR 3 [Bradyrhizobium sp.]|jgi:DNA-binding FadR family transcriptional regulator|nr:lldR 3 [Bradyrhizobium sp.]